MKALKSLSRKAFGGILTLGGLTLGAVTVVRHLRSVPINVKGLIAEYTMAGIATAALVTGFCLLAQMNDADLGPHID